MVKLSKKIEINSTKAAGKSNKSAIKSNKLNIYLIKEHYQDEDSITKISDDSRIKKVEIPKVGLFYYEKSHISSPEWIETFFNNDPAIDSNYLRSSSVKAVLVLNIKIKNKIRYFAIPFGVGRFLLRDSCYVERFGLITALNIIEAKGIRGLDKRTFTTNPKLSREQFSKASDVIEFQVDYEKDLLQAISGKSIDPALGNFVSGKDALSITAKVDITNIKSLLRKVFKTFGSKDYQKSFAWVDFIKELKDETTIRSLDDALVDKLNNMSDSVWLAVPNLIDWANFLGFRYTASKKSKLYEELQLSDYLNEKEGSVTSYEDLIKSKIFCWYDGDEDYTYVWRTYDCLNAEVDLNNGKYFLGDSKWYEVDSRFVSEVDQEINSITPGNLKLFAYKHKNENDYNKAVSSKFKYLCLDAKNLQYGGGQSKIEFCDILTKKKEFIHVKKYGGSALLSHLFQQGSVSAELFISDSEFRKSLINSLDKTYSKLIPEKTPDASQFKIYFAIITQQKKHELPFFSKVALKNIYRRLRGYGFSVHLLWIKNLKSK